MDLGHVLSLVREQAWGLVLPQRLPPGWSPWAPKSRLLVSRADPCLPGLDLPCEWGSAWGEAVHGLTSG